MEDVCSGRWVGGPLRPEIERGVDERYRLVYSALVAFDRSVHYGT